MGLAGNYRDLERAELDSLLILSMTKFDILDLSLDYGIKYNLVDCILNLQPQIRKADYVLKLACNHTDKYDAKELAQEACHVIQKLGEDKIRFVLSHRPFVKKISSDKETIIKDKKQYNFIKSRFSILYYRKFNLNV